MSTQTPHDFSKTQRIVLLIDLNPLLPQNPNPNPKNYLNSILNSIKTLLNFPPLSLSLSSFKLFFSSLSPLLSSSTLQSLSYNPNSLSFNHPHQTLISLSQTLNSLSQFISRNDLVTGSVPKGSITSSSMAQVIHDYAWDLSDSYESCNDRLGVVRSNLVVLFSPVCRSNQDLCDFMGGAGNDVICDGFNDKFRGVFGYVRDAYLSRDIHFSWVDVKYETESSSSSGKSDDLNEDVQLRRMFQGGVRSLGWGFCSTDSIILGTALVPFGLIYPMIGVSSLSYCSDDPSDCSSKNLTGQLNLEILDVSGKPMECKYCDLQLVDVKGLRGQRRNGPPHPGEYGDMLAEMCHQFGGIWERFRSGLVKVDVKGLCRPSELGKIERHTSDVVLVHELPLESKKNKEEASGRFFADKVVDELSKETSKCTKNRSPPLWPILLSFLYRRGYWALVSLSNTDNSTTMGVLKPFTSISAYLSVLKNNNGTPHGPQFGLINSEKGDNLGGLDIGMDSVSGILGGESRRKHKKHPHRYKDLSWSSFCKAAYEHCDMELEEAYFSKGCDTSKKLKFLKCWMKQVVKSSSALSCKSDMPKINSQGQEKTEERLTHLHQDSERPIPSVVREDVSKESQTVGATDSLLEAAEAFFSNLSERIQHGIESGVDLVTLAQRVVCSCIYWLNHKLKTNTLEDSHASVEHSECSTSGGQVARELIKVVLKDPKELTAKHKEKTHNTKRTPKGSSDDAVREYELQILFRMEILQSEVAVGIRDSTKHKFVKQICSLLEFIQCNMEDGFFGDFNLGDYVGRTIKSRYSHNLGGVVHKIYEQMDLFLFDDEDESPNPLLNSEDSSQSWRIGDNDRGSEPNSMDDSFPGADQERKLVEAQERRERALKFASFTRRAMPELQRVWAPKPPKLSRSKSDSYRGSKRKNRRRGIYDMVCETPSSGAKKILFPSEGSLGDQEHWEQRGSSSGSVHKALFQDESFHRDWRP